MEPAPIAISLTFTFSRSSGVRSGRSSLVDAPQKGRPTPGWRPGSHDEKSVKF
jgi:hypothetical protein